MHDHAASEQERHESEARSNYAENNKLRDQLMVAIGALREISVQPLGDYMSKSYSQDTAKRALAVVDEMRKKR